MCRVLAGQPFLDSHNRFPSQLRCGDKAMVKPKPGQRVVLHLDLRITLEAVILNRLACLPRSRRQEWLRGLLVEGFRAECQVLRGAQGEERRSPTRTFANWLTRDVQKPDRSPTPEHIVAEVTAAHTKPASKPFANLGRVIGEGSTAA